MTSFKTSPKELPLKYLLLLAALFVTTKIARAEACAEHKSDAGHASSDYVNLRAEPGSSSKLLRALTFGTKFNVVGKSSACSTIGDKTGRWININTLDDDQIRDGWVFDSYITYQAAAQGTAPELFTAFRIYKEMLPKSFDQVWLGLAKTSHGYEVKQYSLRLKKTSERGIEDYPMYALVTVPEDKVIFLVRGVKNIKPGPVSAALPVSKPIPVWEKKQFTMSLGPEKYHWSTGCVERRREPMDQNNDANKFYSCRLEIKGPVNAAFSIWNSSGEPAFEIPWMPYRAIADLVWAGDLDGDRKLDFLLQETTNSETIDTLYLSSLTARKHIAGRAASIAYVWD